jgi:hypothetical protein
MVRTVSVATAAFLALATALWFASSWIDRGDSTCGSLWRTEYWRGRCDGIMFVRALISAALGLSGAYLVGVIALRRWSTELAVVASAVIVAALCVLTGNEFVRSGGLWAR